jgi:hypothetical protein
MKIGGMRVLVACEFSGTVRDVFTAKGHFALSCDLLPTEKQGHHYQGNVLDILDGWQPVSMSMGCCGDGDECVITGNSFADCKCIGPTQEGVEYREINGILFGRPKDNPNWDLMVAHPPCTYLTCSAEWAYNDPDFERYPGVGYHQKIKAETLAGEARRHAREEAKNFFLALRNAPIQQIAIENPIGCLSKLEKPTQIIQPWMFGDDASKSTCLWLKGLIPLKSTNVVPPRMVGTRPRWANQCDNGQNKLSPSNDRWKIRSKTYQGIADAIGEQWGMQNEVVSEVGSITLS